MPFRQIPSPSPLAARRRLPRALAIVLLGFQTLLWGGGSILEARAAAESLTRYAHVEDQGTTSCPPIHSHLDCLICRTFASGAVAARPRDLLPPAIGGSWVPSAVVVGTSGDGCFGPLGSRAPPVL